jgi:hypothetical protein
MAITTNRMEPIMPRSANAVLVTGDISQDYNIYLLPPQPERRLPEGETRFVGSVGGAAIIQRILAEVFALRNGNVAASFAASEAPLIPTAPAIAGIWQPEPAGKLVQPDNACVWRLARSLELGRTSDLSAVAPQLSLPHMPAGVPPHILVIEDDAGRYRFGPPLCAWPEVLTNPPSSLQWIVLKMTAPLCQGALWWQLARDPDIARRLVVVIPVSDLRLEDVHISKGISWERTAQDIANELLEQPALAGLCHARHVVVTLSSEGALWMRRDASGQPAFRLIFDAQNMEGEWPDAAGIHGGTYGHMSSFTAAVVASLAMAADFTDDRALDEGILRGLCAGRILRLLGHGPVVAGEPRLPVTEVAHVIADDKPRIIGTDLARIDLARLPLYGRADVGDLNASRHPRRWRILEGADAGRPDAEPLYGVARRVAIYGLRALRNVPVARFGKMVTVDRDEIEALRNLKRLIHDYRDGQGEVKPLSLAVFGPPGAGKSFGIMQIAKQVLPDRTPVLEFNLSQFSDERDLIGAFHQVRDKALEGFVPVVFWDEFDSQNYRWLQFLLAPMQDGRFQEGQITHPIGKSIFVFAGATSYDMENFGPPHGDLQAMFDFRLKKGPDFASRLHGFLNVLGPNRRLVCPDSENARERVWCEDPSDVCFPVRRALLLRSMLGLVSKRENERLEIDHGLLAALLEIGKYTHGARSMEKIVATLRSPHGAVIRRSSLPSNEVLAMNVDLVPFQRIMSRSRRFQAYADRLAQAIHDAWREAKRKRLKDESFANDVEFDRLPVEIKAANVAAALRIPRLLEMAGLYLVPCGATPNVGQGDGAAWARAVEELLDILAEEEHVLWMQFMYSNGWRPTDTIPACAEEEAVARSRRLHPCLVPFAELSVDNQDYDREQIRQFPRYAQQAGFDIVKSLPMEI